MLKGISRLNPNAAPYIPIFKSPSVGNNVASQELMGVSAKSEYVDEVAGCQLPNNASLELGLEELHVSSKSSSEMVHPYYSENNTIDDESFDAEKQTVMDETSIVMDFLVSRFPSYSAESLADFLKLNNGNLGDTIDFLEEFEDFISSHDGRCILGCCRMHTVFMRSLRELLRLIVVLVPLVKRQAVQVDQLEASLLNLYLHVFSGFCYYIGLYFEFCLTVAFPCST